MPFFVYRLSVMSFLYQTHLHNIVIVLYLLYLLCTEYHQRDIVVFWMNLNEKKKKKRNDKHKFVKWQMTNKPKFNTFLMSFR